jgi:hypothetical protein
MDPPSDYSDEFEGAKNGAVVNVIAKSSEIKTPVKPPVNPSANTNA